MTPQLRPDQLSATGSVLPAVPCQLCKRTDAQLREVWIEVGQVEIGIRARLCVGCHDTAPELIKAELRGPLIRSVLAVAGARLSFLKAGVTSKAPAARGDR